MSTLILLWYIALFLLPTIIAYVRHAPIAIPLTLNLLTVPAIILIGPFAILLYAAAWVAAFAIRKPLVTYARYER